MKIEERCKFCHKKLMEYKNDIVDGAAAIDVKCPKCGKMNIIQLVK